MVEQLSLHTRSHVCLQNVLHEPSHEPEHPPLQVPPHGHALEELSVALLISGTLARAMAPKIGRADFAAFLKNERRDCNSSFLFFSVILRSLCFSL